MLLVARINPLRRISSEEVDIKCEARHTLQYGDAVFLSRTWIDRTLVNHDITTLQYVADRFGCGEQGSEVWALVGVNWCGDRNNVDPRLSQIGRFNGKCQLISARQFLWGNFFCRVVPCTQRIDPACTDIKPNHGSGFPKLHSNGKAHVAKADNGNFFYLRCHFPE